MTMNISKLTLAFAFMASAAAAAPDASPSPAPFVPVSMVSTDVRDLPLTRNNAYIQLTLNQAITQGVGENLIYIQDGAPRSWNTIDVRRPYCVLETEPSEFIRDFKVGRTVAFHRAEDQTSVYTIGRGDTFQLMCQMTTKLHVYGEDKSFTKLRCATAKAAKPGQFACDDYPAQLTLPEIERIMGQGVSMKAAVVRVVGQKYKNDELIAVDPDAHSNIN